VHAADPALPLVDVRTHQDQIDSDFADERLLVSLTSAFGLLALVLASVGIYGVMAYSVAQRTRSAGYPVRQVDALWDRAIRSGHAVGAQPCC
jgi:ABC-type antimicrobial peptide transport system permease subunit